MKLITCPQCGGTGKVPDRRFVGEELRELRKKAGLTLQFVANSLGISTGYLCDLENGNRGWTMERVEKYRETVAEKGKG